MRTSSLSLLDFQQAIPALKRKGGEWSAPCPRCGGVDRFHVREVGHGDCRWGCRGCIDGQPESVKRDNSSEITRMLFPELYKKKTNNADNKLHARYPRMNWRRENDAVLAAKELRMMQQAHEAQPHEAQDNEAKDNEQPGYAHPQDIWDAAVEVDNTPAAEYLLEERRCWLYNRPFPSSLAWLPAEAFPELSLPLPYIGGGGALLFAYKDMHGVVGIQSELLNAHGRRTEPRVRKAFGDRQGGICAVGNRSSRIVLITEGEVAALAAFVLYQLEYEKEAQVISAGGANNMRNLAALLTDKERVYQIIPDNDAVGRDASLVLAHRMHSAGMHVAIAYRLNNGFYKSDVADMLSLP